MRSSVVRARSEGGTARAWTVAALLPVVAYLLLIVLRAAPSLTDYANWTYQGALLATHLRGQVDPAHRLKPYPVPNTAATLGIGLLCLLLPWLAAAKLWLVLQTAVALLALRRLARVLGAGLTPWLVVPQAVFFNVNFWYGFVNFELGLAWVMFTAAVLIERERDGLPLRWTPGSLLVACFFTHMIPFAFVCLLVVLFARQTRRWSVLWQLVPGAVLTLAYVVGRYGLAHDADGATGMADAVRSYSPAFWLLKGNSVLKSFGYVNPGGANVATLGTAGLLAAFTLNAALVFLLLWLMARAARQAFTTQAGPRFVWLGVLLVLPLALLLPGTAFGVSDPGARLWQVACAVAVPLGLAGRARMLQAAGAGGSVLSLLGVFLFVRFGCAPRYPAYAAGRLPHAIAEFAHVPNDDQDYFYRALERGDLTLSVFPTGVLLNETRPPEQGPRR